MPEKTYGRCGGCRGNGGCLRCWRNNIKHGAIKGLDKRTLNCIPVFADSASPVIAKKLPNPLTRDANARIYDLIGQILPRDRRSERMAIFEKILMDNPSYINDNETPVKYDFVFYRIYPEYIPENHMESVRMQNIIGSSIKREK